MQHAKTVLYLKFGDEIRSLLCCVVGGWAVLIELSQLHLLLCCFACAGVLAVCVWAVGLSSQENQHASSEAMVVDVTMVESMES